MERALRGRGRRGGGSGAPAETLDVRPTLMAGGGRFTWNRIDLEERVDCSEEREAREQQRHSKNRGFYFHRSLLVTEVLKSGERALNIGEIERERFGAGMLAAEVDGEGGKLGALLTELREALGGLSFAREVQRVRARACGRARLRCAPAEARDLEPAGVAGLRRLARDRVELQEHVDRGEQRNRSERG